MKKGIIAAIATLTGAGAGITASGILLSKTVAEKESKVSKFKSYYNMLNQWLILKQEGKDLIQYFTDNNYKKIAIYGMGEMGNRLYDELKDSDIKIAYAIDKNIAAYSELEILDVDDDFPEVDVIVVSAIFAFEEVDDELSEKISCPIVSLEDVVYEI